MPFDQGTITFRICRLPQSMPEDAIEKFAALVAPPLEDIQDEPVWGWVSPRHLLDTRIDETTIKFAGHYHLCLRQAERKIPASLLTAECRMVELTRMAEKDVDHLNKKERRTIKEDVKQRLLPTMPPQLSGVYFAIDNSEDLLYTTATSQHPLDLFLSFFSKTFGFEPIPLTPEPNSSSSIPPPSHPSPSRRTSIRTKTAARSAAISSRGSGSIRRNTTAPCRPPSSEISPSCWTARSPSSRKAPEPLKRLLKKDFRRFRPKPRPPSRPARSSKAPKSSSPVPKATNGPSRWMRTNSSSAA